MCTTTVLYTSPSGINTPFMGCVFFTIELWLLVHVAVRISGCKIPAGSQNIERFSYLISFRWLQAIY